MYWIYLYFIYLFIILYKYLNKEYIYIFITNEIYFLLLYNNKLNLTGYIKHYINHDTINMNIFLNKNIILNLIQSIPRKQSDVIVYKNPLMC